MEVRLRDWPLLAQVIALRSISAGGEALREPFKRLRRDERGQTPTEYLMIVGLMAMAIVTIFTVIFWDTVRGAVVSWSERVRKAVSGEGAMQ